jgi:transketolase
MTGVTDAPPALSAKEARFLGELGQQLRADSIRCSTAAGSGHPTSAMSAADLMAVLLARHLRYDWDNPREPGNDHLIFSKGHASPLLYSMFKAAGAITDEELVTGFRRFGSRLQGHPTPALPWVDVATGSLGQGLPYGVGIALAGRRLDRLPYQVWVLCGDSEMAEGSMWEALDKAAYYRLGNLTAIIDVNRLGQRGPTELEWDTGAYRRRAESFGCAAAVVDGHDIAQIDAALGAARQAARPTVMLAKTVKGKGFSEIEDKNGWHGRPLPADMALRALAELGGERKMQVTTPRPVHHQSPRRPGPAPVTLPRYETGAAVATRKAYGDALVALGARPEVVALDGEVGNSTYAGQFAAAYPDRFFEMFISEQQLIAAAVGLAVRRYVPFASTFAAFFSRGYDFLRMAGISGANIKLCGSHAGVEIGPDGPSQMALEDLAAFRAIHGSTVLYPCDATSAARLVAEMAATPGIVYLRTTRGAWPVLYPDGETFPIGGCKVLRASHADEVTLIGAGVTVHQCLRAAGELAADGAMARVIDLYSVKPLDQATLAAAAEATGGRLVIAEDHYPQGGLGGAVLEALAGSGQPLRVRQCAVGGLPGSGTPDELMEAAGISASRIAAAARTLLAG